MNAIWKYPITVSDTFTKSMPTGATVLSVHVQYGYVCMWVEVDPAAAKVQRKFRILGTGHDIPSDETRTFIGTFMLSGDALVFHLFEIDEPTP